MADPLPLPVLGATSRPGDFFVGLTSPFRAIGLVRSRPPLRRIARWMAGVTALSLVLIAWLLARYSDDLLAWLWPRPENAFAVGLWFLLVAIVFLTLFAISAALLPPILLTPLQDPLSESVEDLATGTPPPPFALDTFLRSTTTGLAHTLGRLVLVLLALLLLFPLNFLPGIGSLLYAALATAVSALGLAAEHLGSPMARHLLPWAAVRRLLRARLPLFLGFGLGCHVLLWVPILNFFFLPYVIVGGTLLFLALREAGGLPTGE